MCWPRPSVPRRHWRLFVSDIIDAIEAIERFAFGLTEETFFSPCSLRCRPSWTRQALSAGEDCPLL